MHAWKSNTLTNKFRDDMVENGTIPSIVDNYMMKKGGVAVSKQQKKAREFAKKIRFTTDPALVA